MSIVLAAIVMAVLCGFIGNFVVMRGLSFFADTLAHGALLGIALGYLLGLDPRWVILPSSVLLALVLGWFTRNRNQNLSSLVAVVFSIAVGGGILLLSYQNVDGEEVLHLLFGDLQSVKVSDLILLLGVGVPTAIWFYRNLKGILLLFINRDFAHVAGVKSAYLDYSSLIAIALTVAVCIKLVGVLLVTALITLPPMIAGPLAKNFKSQLLLSSAVGVFATLLGMLAAAHRSLPSGGCIALVLGALFVFTTFIRK